MLVLTSDDDPGGYVARQLVGEVNVVVAQDARNLNAGQPVPCGLVPRLFCFVVTWTHFAWFWFGFQSATGRAGFAPAEHHHFACTVS